MQLNFVGNPVYGEAFIDVRRSGDILVYNFLLKRDTIGQQVGLQEEIHRLSKSIDIKIRFANEYRPVQNLFFIFYDDFSQIIESKYSKTVEIFADIYETENYKSLLRKDVGENNNCYLKIKRDALGRPVRSFAFINRSQPAINSAVCYIRAITLNLGLDENELDKTIGVVDGKIRLSNSVIQRLQRAYAR